MIHTVLSQSPSAAKTTGNCKILSGIRSESPMVATGTEKFTTRLSSPYSTRPRVRTAGSRTSRKRSNNWRIITRGQTFTMRLGTPVSCMGSRIMTATAIITIPATKAIMSTRGRHCRASAQTGTRLHSSSTSESSRFFSGS